MTDKRPVIVPSHVDAAGNGPLDLGQVREQKSGPLIVVVIRQAVLGDIKRLAQAGSALEYLIHPGGIDLAIGAVSAAVTAFGPRCRLQQFGAVPGHQTEADAPPGVVVDAHKVAAVDQWAVGVGPGAQGEAQPAILDGQEGHLVEHVVEQPGRKG